MKITDVTLSILRTELGEGVIPTVDERGFIAAPQKPGLGYDIDLDEVENLTLQRF